MTERILYVGSYTHRDSEGIYIYRFDTQTGALRHEALAAEQEHPSFLTFHPQGHILYAVGEDNEAGHVNSYAIDPASGGLTFLNRQPTHGTAPCHLVVEPGGRTLVVANYYSGNVAVYPLKADGSIGDPVQNIQHHGSGPNQERQEAAHAHSATMSPDGSRVYVADLGCDKVMIYRLVNGRLVANDPDHVAVQGGAGPRHFDFHPNGRNAYIINELDLTVTVCAFNAETGALDPIQTISTLPDDVDDKSGLSTADIHVSADGRFVYGSNRHHNTLAIFSVDQDSGRLTAAGHASTRGQTPRNFTIDPTGAWVLAANQDSDDICVFSRDADNGQLTPAGDMVWAPMAVCLLFGP
ncbi:MAG: lactonase family protein [Caldilineaceae bacterium SB0661_bin_32]|uniref:Lactonase family protein n=1 Tax=Caldilineaceae bacterium SB0661_bin_32 TaxID=2605255 RepID=A0A6B1D431_9CHLR|nr:lactonase family protein [Caldilineaceae bacterium SB0661_bin_32]